VFFRLVDFNPAVFEMSETLRMPESMRVQPQFVVRTKNWLLEVGPKWKFMGIILKVHGE
jgi:hypothetical protein